MRVICPECGEKARIQKSNRISASYSDLYCSCSDPECGHTFVMNLTFSHTLSPSSKTTSQMAFELVKALSSESRKELKNQLLAL
ncbi:ogr/Delta-like zinc finger family protein [Vibrio parahaemolyticus]|uniref:ogr/Delta-like zinc finger family protein n=1 Tax=Vibrio parahaemolyticus TaxID=670 RepID=UPI00090378A9|nr:ogr/Delta-like zinc finger family protein [Vibrio parahaemolyticus]EGQ7792758.1 ogr/Delta-like zinc finger family protein [Vibrio parahaemolyticus]EGQ7809346.1 ogr/Delta-like zinc finger family protein [Vibrio parahaemolyticus]EGQ8533250.1 transcriptional regulator [Vibrio parahaemolyticus]EGU9320221.1 transcriptional regulator [Vibrio parahaemolyticus]EIV8648091.1 ogr/Delta-like zinc finger family protein [Vibrio parahaemolyticus]